MIFVYNQDGERLMPTHPAKARILLKRNQCEYIVYGFRRYDIVKYDNQFWYINALGINGSFQLKQLNSNKVTRRIYKKLKLIQKRNKYIWS